MQPAARRDRVRWQAAQLHKEAAAAQAAPARQAGEEADGAGGHGLPQWRWFPSRPGPAAFLPCGESASGKGVLCGGAAADTHVCVRPAADVIRRRAAVQCRQQPAREPVSQPIAAPLLRRRVAPPELRQLRLLIGQQQRRVGVRGAATARLFPAQRPLRPPDEQPEQPQHGDAAHHCRDTRGWRGRHGRHAPAGRPADPAAALRARAQQDRWEPGRFPRR
mmetsp:Transcript_27355/g.68905  ORF Transcript_27355/g.68905 Transcript_27355/m.68905 type:complete len:220 (-) Transcript_27355:186-845(-)